MAALDRLKSAPWWVLILVGLFGVPFVLRLVSRVA